MKNYCLSGNTVLHWGKQTNWHFFLFLVVLKRDCMCLYCLYIQNHQSHSSNILNYIKIRSGYFGGFCALKHLANRLTGVFEQENNSWWLNHSAAIYLFLVTLKNFFFFLSEAMEICIYIFKKGVNQSQSTVSIFTFCYWHKYQGCVCVCVYHYFLIELPNRHKLVNYHPC